MSDPKTQQEPSMEEILASIRRIIAEDGQGEPEAAAAASGEPAKPAAKEGNGAEPEEDVIELTEVVEEPPAAAAPAPEPAKAPEESSALEVSPAAEPAIEPVEAMEPQPEEDVMGEEPVSEFVDAAERGAAEAMEDVAEPPHEAPRRASDRLVSPHAADQAMHAFGALASVLHGQEGGAGLPLGQGTRTIEDIVRDLLRPMLREWLDENLPELVQRIVQKEIREMVRRAED